MAGQFGFQVINPSTVSLRIGGRDDEDDNIDLSDIPDDDSIDLSDIPDDPVYKPPSPINQVGPAQTNQPPPEERGPIGQAWDWYNKPLTDLPSTIAKRLSESIDPQQGTSGLRSIASAYVEGLGNAVTGMTSPSNLTPIGAGYGAAKTGLTSLSRLAKGASGLQAVHGGQEMIRPDASLFERGMGALEAYMGGKGVRQNYLPKSTQTIQGDSGTTTVTGQIPEGWSGRDMRGASMSGEPAPIVPGEVPPIPESFGPDAYAGPERRNSNFRSTDPEANSFYTEYREKLARGEDVRSKESRALLEKKSGLDTARKEAKIVERNGEFYEQTGINPDTNQPTYKRINRPPDVPIRKTVVPPNLSVSEIDSLASKLEPFDEVDPMATHALDDLDMQMERTAIESGQAHKAVQDMKKTARGQNDHWNKLDNNAKRVFKNRGLTEEQINSMDLKDVDTLYGHYLGWTDSPNKFLGGPNITKAEVDAVMKKYGLKEGRAIQPKGERQAGIDAIFGGNKGKKPGVVSKFLKDEEGSINLGDRDPFGHLTREARDKIINRKFGLTEGPVGEAARTGMRRVISAIQKAIGKEDYAALPDDDWRAKFGKTRTEQIGYDIDDAIKYLKSQGMIERIPGQAAESTRMIELLERLKSEANAAKSTTYLEKLRAFLNDEEGSINFGEGFKDKTFPSNPRGQTVEPVKSGRPAGSKTANPFGSKRLGELIDKDKAGTLTAEELAEARLLMQKLREKGTVPPNVPNKPTPPSTGGTPPTPPKGLVPSVKKASVAQELWDLPRSLMSVDLPFMTSAAFRQASPHAWTPRWFKAWGKAAKAYGDEGAYNLMQKKIADNPLNKRPVKGTKPDGTPVYGKSVADRMKLRFSDLKTRTGREDFLKSTWAEKIPLYGKAVRASNRSYTAFLNDLRISSAEKLYKQAVAAGKADDDVFLEALGEFVNTSTGAGKLGIEIGISPKIGAKLSFEKNAEMISNVLFSGRNLASRMRMMNPSTYAMAPAGVRKEYVKGLLRSVGTWYAFAGLAKMAGADVNLDDPTNADYGKVKIGDTRFDSGAGTQQLLVLLAREYYGGTTSSEHKPGTPPPKFKPYGTGAFPQSAGGQIADFSENKLNPWLKLATDILQAHPKDPVQIGDRMIQMAAPMMASDLASALQEEPELMDLVVPPLSSIGIGAQTYDSGPRGEPVYLPKQYDYTIKESPLVSMRKAVTGSRK